MRNTGLLLISPICLCFSTSLAQPVYTATIYPFNLPFATGYVDGSSNQYSGTLQDISNGQCLGAGGNIGFIIFDASVLPAGAAITAATVELSLTGFCTGIPSQGLGLVTGISENTIQGEISRGEIANGTVYADKLDWTSSSFGPVTCPLGQPGVDALQKSVGATFCIGIKPPTSTNNTRTFSGYNSSSATAPQPALRVSYTIGNPAKPSARFTANARDTFVSSGIKFYDNSGNYPTSWLWDFGDGTTSTEQNPTHIYTDTGSYTIKLVSQNAKGVDSAIKQHYIAITPAPSLPVVEFAVNTRNTSAGEVLTFTDLSVGAIINWEWDFGDGETSYEQNPLHSYASDGIYPVALIISGPAGSDTLTKESFINVGGDIEIPVADFSFSNVNALTVSFKDSSANFPDTWSWDFGDGQTANTQNPIHEFLAEGHYDVCLDAANTSGSNQLCKTVSISSTGIPGLFNQDGSFNIYPNPFDEQLTVEWTGRREENSTVEIYDGLGRLFYQKRINSAINQINMSATPKGFYFLKLNVKGRNYIQGIVKN